MFNNSGFSLKAKISTLTIVVLSVFSIINLVGTLRTQALGTEIQERSLRLHQVDEIAEKTSQINQAAQFLVLNSMAGSSNEIDRKKSVEALKDGLDKVSDSLKKQSIDSLMVSFEIYKKDVVKLSSLILANDNLTAAEFALKEAPSHYQSFAGAVDKERDGILVKFGDSISSLKTFSQIILVGLLTFGVGAFLFSLFSSERIFRPIYDSNSVLEGTVREVSQAAKVTLNNSVFIQDSSMSVRDSINEITAALEELNHMVKANIDSTNSSQLVTRESSVATLECHSTVTSLGTSIGLLSNTIEKFVGEISEIVLRIQKLVEQIQVIANKTEIINEIVFQTRLLSFNASVEAARAGESGRGFSVVAEEVGKLASVSGKAAEEITALVSEGAASAKALSESIRAKVGDLTGVVRESVSTGNQLAKSSINSLDRVVGNMRALERAIESIGRASSEQSIGIRTVNEAIVRVSGISINNHELSVSSHSSSLVLEQRAKQLDELVIKIDSVLTGKAS